MIELPSREKSCLSNVWRLIAAFHEESIVYCHWKSNEHVLQGMLGLTDLDILVDRAACPRLNELLSRTDFKRFSAVPSRVYPGVEDYIGLDEETGRIVHLHLHYQLTLGEKHLKGYRLPWEELILSTRRLDPAAGIYVADPHVEMLLLVVRAVLKLRTRDRLLSLAGKPYFRGDMLKEYLWLKQRTEAERVQDLARDLLGEGCAKLLRSILDGAPSLDQLLAFKRHAHERLQLYRTYGPTEAAWRRWSRELSIRFWRIGKKCFGAPLPLDRTIPRGGLIVAIVGADGSGKSTIVKKTTECLASKIAVVPIYFGSGDGSKSPLRRLLQTTLTVAGRTTKAAKSAASGTAATSTRGGSKSHSPVRWLKSTADLLVVLLIASEKRKNLRRAVQARNRGMLVICDRYPQTQVLGFNDGPRLTSMLNHRSWLLRSLARWESQSYEYAVVCPPDLVIKLNVDPLVAFQRKEDMSIEEVRRRVAAVKSLRYPSTTNVVEICADDPPEVVLRRAKQLLWNSL
ncbi:MAG: hypothetical protein EPO21_03370 [Chloroflexota bacterium]|nr:MAG: hypothetical protein EPO21_03370 [Chloroflexota bacterium]